MKELDSLTTRVNAAKEKLERAAPVARKRKYRNRENSVHDESSMGESILLHRLYACAVNL